VLSIKEATIADDPPGGSFPFSSEPGFFLILLKYSFRLLIPVSDLTDKAPGSGPKKS